MLYFRLEYLGFCSLTVLELFKKRNLVCFGSLHSSYMAIPDFQNKILQISKHIVI